MTTGYRQTDFRLWSWSVPDPSLSLPREEALWGLASPHGRHNVIMRSLALGEPQLGCAHMIVISPR